MSNLYDELALNCKVIYDDKDFGYFKAEHVKELLAKNTQREEFAKAAMQGLLAGLFNAYSDSVVSHGWSDKEIAKESCNFADALLKELAKEVTT